MDRQGYASRLIWYPESAFNSDTGITTGHIVPLVDTSGFGDSSDPTEIPVFMGNGLLPYSTVDGLIQAGGALPVGLEYEFFGHAAKPFFTANGYLRPGGGTNSLHEFVIPVAIGSVPGSFQLQAEWLEGVPVYHRGRGGILSGIGCEGNSAGYVRDTLDVVATGSIVRTDLGGTKTDNGRPSSSYQHGRMTYEVSGTKSVIGADVTGFRCRLYNGASRREAFYNAGVAGAINSGVINADGELALAMQNGGSGPSADLNFYDDAVNARTVFIDVVQANAPLAVATKYRRWRLAIRLYRMAPKPGGAQGVTYTQRWRFANPENAVWAAEYIATIPGPYNTTVNNKLGIKPFDGAGGATTVVTVPSSAALSSTDLLNAVNAALPGRGDLFMDQLLRITSPTKGATSSVQIDTTIANSMHAALGFDGIARAGRSNCPVICGLKNSRTTDY